MRVKICGLTNEADALAAVEAGADYLGFNFHARSPRLVTAAQCARLVRAVRATGAAVKTVGIFVEQTAEETAQLLDECGLDLAQLHGHEPLERLEILRGRAFRAIRDGVDNGTDLDALAQFGPGKPSFLMDAYSPSAYGGTGRTGDWNRAREAASRYPIFLAGGLSPENVAAAIEAVRPWGVDVASGVESAPGKKDPLRVREFIERAKRKQEMQTQGTQGS